MKGIMATLSFTGLAVLAVLPWYNNALHAPDRTDADRQAFVVSAGESLASVSGRLESAGLIRSGSAFTIHARVSGLAAKIQAGEYALTGDQSAQEVIAILASGRTVRKERDIILIEGWRLDDMAAYLKQELGTVGDDFLRLTTGPLAPWPFEFPRPELLADAPAGADLEGYIFPDTYRIYNDASAESIINKALANFAKKFTPEMAAAAGRQGHTVYEILTMASIVEREVRTEADMKIVSGIFWDRIGNSQALESCASLAYILKEDKPQYTYDDTRIDSPYNTYLNRGLPPGPIDNPGLQAIRAALEPTPTDYNYFLSRPDTGETVFARTYNEHLANKAKYLQ